MTSVKSASNTPTVAAGNADAGPEAVSSTDVGAVIDALSLTKSDLLHTFQQMLDVRHFEEICSRAYDRNKVGGYLHLYIGQEAVSMGVIHACRQGDQLLSSYRDHAHCLVLGSDPGRVLAEIFGKSTGLSRGKGGSMHLFDKERGFAGGYGIVGGNVPISVGIGWALKQKSEGNICVCFVGDGAMNAGGFHEALNMAGLYKLPVFYVLENNGYAMGTSVQRSSANTDLASRADSYAIPHSRVDGQDYFAVRAAAESIVQDMRSNPYPYFLEVVTYRYVGHGAADRAETQATYRSTDEIERWKRRDPVKILELALRDRGLLDDDIVKKMDDVALGNALNALEFANSSADCAPVELSQDVYV